jgi:hypothetical protein
LFSYFFQKKILRDLAKTWAEFYLNVLQKFSNKSCCPKKDSVGFFIEKLLSLKNEKLANFNGFLNSFGERYEKDLGTRGVRQHCYRKKAATVGQNGRLSASCNFFSF